MVMVMVRVTVLEPGPGHLDGVGVGVGVRVGWASLVGGESSGAALGLRSGVRLEGNLESQG